MADGTRRTILNDLVEDYAAFISQRMQKHLDDDLAMIGDAYDVANVTRLTEAHDESDEVDVTGDRQRMQGQWR